jgi:hypothetical protein
VFPVLFSFVKFNRTSLEFPRMKKILLNTLKYISFLAIGVIIFWQLYKGLEWEEIRVALRDLKYPLIILSVTLSVFSHLVRAWRWKMLLKPMGYIPSTFNTFLSVLVLYFVNLIVPRAGEVARCTVLAQTDRIPFAKLLGTVFIERIADFLMLILLSIIIFALNVPIIVRFFNENLDMQTRLDSFLNPIPILIASGILLVLVLATVYLYRRLRKSKIREKLIRIKDQFIEGIRTIMQMKHKWLFILYTCSIFLLWLIMLYVVFLAYEPTAHLTLRVGMVAFLMGGLAMLAPVQGGIGPWHYMVIQTLLLFGVSENHGKIFAAVAHSSTNLIYLLIGGGALIYLIFKYGRSNISLRQKNNIPAI